MTDDNRFHLYNTKTMSGIHLGSRTARVHIVRLQTVDVTPRPHGWARILWPGETEGCAIYLQESDGSWEDQPFLSLLGGDGKQIVPALMEALTATGRRALVCGSCHWWQPLQATANEDGIPLGLCKWMGDDPSPEPSAKSREQSSLAMECPHWQAVEQPALPGVESIPAPPPQKASGWWATLKSRFAGKSDRETPAPVVEIVERSGVGAGTERCLACHGRIANLGALTVATENDDKRTLSVWRCRLCYTFYLNDWIDRWERLDSLETEESYYRIAPDEALALLSLFRETRGGEHPKERHSRTAQRAQMDAFLINRPRLLHQIKQGR
ncbi:MAG: hypothetical protein HY328_07055 [Chloroflexi bacterium]|nr:hypothetical protein [Chloroflexota bacterium]